MITFDHSNPDSYDTLIRRIKDIGDMVQGIVNDAKEVIEDSILDTSPGRVYTIDGVTYQASLPGDPPNVFRGELLGAIAVEAVDRYTYAVGVEDKAPVNGYAEILEWGGENEGGVYVAPRPFMTPAQHYTANEIIPHSVKLFKRDVEGLR